MSVKRFKFVSPGVFINEIDNSFIPKSAEEIGPVVVGRARRGLAMQPVKVQSYSHFVEMFGDTVPGNGGGDIYREGNYQSPMYGTYAAKAFLRSNVAPLTYVRLLGQQDSNPESAGEAGWKTQNNPNVLLASNGGAYGLFVFPSGSSAGAQNAAAGGYGALAGTGSLAAIWYLDESSGNQISLSGTVFNTHAGMSPVLLNLSGTQNSVSGGIGVIIEADSNKLFTVVIGGTGSGEKIKFGLDDTKETFIRKRFNTNPQLTSTGGTLYPAGARKVYWLGETFTQQLRSSVGNRAADAISGQGISLTGSGTNLTTANLLGVILPLALSGTVTTGPQNMSSQASREAVAGWFISQDLGAAVNFVPESMQKLFRLKGRGHGEWLHKNVKVSIQDIRTSTAADYDYGSFSVVLRSISDNDNDVVILERFDGCTLDPTSPTFVARKIGDQYLKWDTTQKRLRRYGEYANLSKFVYVEMNSDVEAGATDPLYLPFGYYGPPKWTDVINIGKSDETRVARNGLFPTGSVWVGAGGVNSSTVWNNKIIALGGAGTGVSATVYNVSRSVKFSDNQANPTLQGNMGIDSVGAVLTTGSFSYGQISASLIFPTDRLRSTASDGGMSDPTNAYFGYQTTRTRNSTKYDASTADSHRLLFSGFPDDPTLGAIRATALKGCDGWGYIFTLDDVKKDAVSDYCWQSGSRSQQISVTSASYADLLNQGFNRFTAPLWGGFDGFDINLPDPLYNAGMTVGSSTERNSSTYYTYKRAIDTVADPEYLDMNLLSVPGLTNDDLTNHMITVAAERADTLALIDLKDVYVPSSEAYYSDKANRLRTTPTQASNNLRDRRLNSSYGCTFYPWVQTRDEGTGTLLWVPPSVAMMGVLASSQAKADLWFAPAGFNRGGLTEGAAGIPITGVTERLTSKDRDTLYDARINPIASFPNTGIVVFGQKTLQEGQSALDRINVRRLVIYLKKQISILSTQILFEQNVQATWNRFKSLVEPFLANVKTNFGITDYRLILDESTTTPDLIDQNIMYAKIMIKPARAIEYIAIDFVIASTGASFDD